MSVPFDYAAITRILPHRYPFLLVDRITEFEPERRIVGLKNVSSNEPYIVRCDGAFVLPPTILMEAMAQVGAILVLAKPEYHDRLIYFSACHARATGGRRAPGTSSSWRRGWIGYAG